MKTIVKKPLITEKAALMQKANVYAFECDVASSKEEIKSAIEKMFDVKVTKINTSICRGRAKVTKHGPGKIAYWKRALVKLQEGSKITIFEGM